MRKARTLSNTRSRLNQAVLQNTELCEAGFFSENKDISAPNPRVLYCA